MSLYFLALLGSTLRRISTASVRISKEAFLRILLISSDLASINTMVNILLGCALLASLINFIACKIFAKASSGFDRSEEHTSELQSRPHLVCRLLLEKKNKKHI